MGRRHQSGDAGGPGARRRDARCTFCGKRQDQVKRLIAGPGVYICDQCVGLCNEILAEGGGQSPGGRRVASSRLTWRSDPLGWLRDVFRRMQVQPSQARPEPQDLEGLEGPEL